MNVWYYVEGNRQRQGPLPPENMLELYRSGRIGLDTLVWRDGLPTWQPLADFAAELGLPDAPAPFDAATSLTPPPLPPAPPQPAPATASIAPAPARTGLSGCAIAAIIGAVVGVILLGVLGILAAIAVPAYQDYLQRAKTSSALAEMQTLQPAIEAFHSEQGRCPVNGDNGFGTPESYAGNTLAELRIGRFDDGHCGMEATLATPEQHALDGKAMWLDYDEAAQTWSCSSEIDDRLLPQQCRG